MKWLSMKNKTEELIYSETCVNWSHYKTKSSFNGTLNEVQMRDIIVNFTCINRNICLFRIKNFAPRRIISDRFHCSSKLQASSKMDIFLLQWNMSTPYTNRIQENTSLVPEPHLQYFIYFLLKNSSIPFTTILC